jgi:hypothetical protein
MLPRAFVGHARFSIFFERSGGALQMSQAHGWRIEIAFIFFGWRV